MIRALIIMAKAPYVGAVKSRLQPALTPGSAAIFQRAALLDMLRRVWPVERRILFLDRPHELIEWSARREGWQVVHQEGAELGERMEHAFDWTLRAGGQRIAMVGSDCPHLPARDVHEQLDSLKSEMSIGLTPAADGGYVLIAGRRAPRLLFRDIPWSTSAVFEVSRRRCVDAGIPVQTGRVAYDLDTVADLERLWLDSRRRPSWHHVHLPATMRALRTLFQPHVCPGDRE